MDPMTLISLIMGGGSMLGGLFGMNNSNPNAQFGDPNNPMYQTMQKNYFSGLQNSLNAASPGTQQLLAMQMAHGGDYGGSSYIAGKQRQDIMTKKTDAATQSTNQFMSNMYGQGLGLYGQGNAIANLNQNSFANNLLGLGGGLFARGMNNGRQNQYGQQGMFGMQNNNGYQVPNYMLDYMSPNTQGA